MKKAVLIIHDFAGTTYDNEYLANYLQLDNRFSIFIKTLPGHAIDENYQKVKYEEWLNEINQTIEQLINYGYQELYLIGHGLGGIISAICKTKFQEIKKIVFLNTSFKYLNFKNNKINIITNKDYKDYVELFENTFHTSIPFFLEFVKLVKTYQNVLKEIDIDSLVLQGELDEIISLENAKDIYDNINTDIKTLTYLKNENHVVLSGSNFNLERKKEISEYIRLFLRGGKKWKKNKKEKI